MYFEHPQMVQTHIHKAITFLDHLTDVKEKYEAPEITDAKAKPINKVTNTERYSV